MLENRDVFVKNYASINKHVLSNGKFQFNQQYENSIHIIIGVEYTANVYRVVRGLCRHSLLCGNSVIFTDCREIL